MKTQKIEQFKALFDKSDTIIIGAGSGLSTAAGLLYDDFDTFNTWFPGYYQHYGLRSINEALFYQFHISEEQYAWWARFISAVRYKYPPGKPYLDLHRIIRNKDYFVLTTNTDGQFLKSGFESDKICFPQGDLAFFQCSRSCIDELYPNEQTVRQILSHITSKDFAIPTADIPHCPNCGSPLLPNIRINDTFVEKPWIGQYQKIIDLINANKGKHILLLELGVGTNTPGIIRYPFEHLVLQRKNTCLIRINLNSNALSLLTNSENYTFIQADIGTVLAKLAEEK